jgi:hypothetical protein
VSRKINSALEPGDDKFNPVEVGKHLTVRLNEFSTPMALSCYWYAPKNKERLKLLPNKWQDELNRRYYERLNTLICDGPFY